jgi:DNA repair protein RecO (recombination protein O)
MLTKDTAICIRTVDYSETSQIATFFTRANGKLTAIAKGSKRPKSAFDGPVEIFSLGQIVFTTARQGRLSTLTEFQQRPSFTHLRCDLFALNCSLFAGELVNGLTSDYDPHPQLFDSLLQFLENAQAAKGKPEVLKLLILFQLTLLKEVGLRPVLNACANCKNSYQAHWPRVYFSSSANGLICRDCEASFADRMKLTRRAANCLDNLRLIAESQQETLNEVEKVLTYHFTELLGKPPKMAKYVIGT